MKIKILKSLLSILFVSFFSCHDTIKEDRGNLKTIDISKVYNNEKEVLLSSIADSIYYIPLQTDNEVLLNKVYDPWMNIQFTNDRIFISDRKQLFVFDYSGKFINQIGRQGNGPGEFIKIYNFTVLEKKQQVVIFNQNKQELLLYDFKGAFLKSVKTDIWPTELASFNKELIVLGNTKGNRIYSDYHTVSILDENYNIQNSLIRYITEKEIEKEKQIQGFSLANFYNYCDTLSQWEFQYDTIWRIPEKTIAYPAYVIELGKEKLPFKYLLREFVNQDNGEYVDTERVLETKRYFFFNIAYKKFLKHVLYSKYDDSSICIKHTKNNTPYFSFVNDLDGGLPFWPDGVIDEKSVYSLVSGIELKSKIEENLKPKTYPSVRNNLTNIIKNTQLNDNPIIMVVKLKR